MAYPNDKLCIAFAGAQRIATGPLVEVAAAAKQHLDRAPLATILIFDAATSAPVDLDFRGTVADVLARLGPAAGGDDAEAGDGIAEEPGPRDRGRPKLGVVGREVTLLPRHWDWLQAQPGGASPTLRRLVETAMRSKAGAMLARQARDAAYRFMAAIGGDLPGFEDATRALFAGDKARFADLLAPWPVDIRTHAMRLAEPSFAKELPAG